MNPPSPDHPVCEAVMDLRRLGLSFGQVLELSKCSKPFLVQVYKALHLPTVHKTKPMPFGDKKWLKELVIEFSDDSGDEEANEIAKSLQDKENEIEKMRKYIASLERCPSVKEDAPKKIVSEVAQEIAQKIVEPDLPKPPIYSVSQKDKLIVSTIMRQIDQQGREKSEVLELLEKERAEIKDIYDTLRSKENLIDILLAKISEKDSLLAKYENAKCVILEKLAKERVDFERGSHLEHDSEDVIVIDSSENEETEAIAQVEKDDDEKSSTEADQVECDDSEKQTADKDDHYNEKVQELDESVNQEYEDCGEYGEVVEEEPEGEPSENLSGTEAEQLQYSEDPPGRESLSKSPNEPPSGGSENSSSVVVENTTPEQSNESIQEDLQTKVSTTSHNAHTQDCFQPYKSALSGLRAYKLGPFFDREKLSSATFSNKIDPEVQLCPRDLSKGSCNYSECRYQHIKDTRQDDTEIVAEIAKNLAGFTPEEQTEYVNELTRFLENNKGKPFDEISGSLIEFRNSRMPQGTFLNHSQLFRKRKNGERKKKTKRQKL